MGRTRGVWYPDLVGKVPGYSLTQETHDEKSRVMRERIVALTAKGPVKRTGVPFGWAGMKPQLAKVRAAAVVDGRRAVALMIEKDLLVPLPTDDAGLAIEALEYAAGVVRDPTVPHRERLQAAKLLAEFTKAKPSQRQEVTVLKAEDYLAEVLGE